MFFDSQSLLEEVYGFLIGCVDLDFNFAGDIISALLTIKIRKGQAKAILQPTGTVPFPSTYHSLTPELPTTITHCTTPSCHPNPRSRPDLGQIRRPYVGGVIGHDAVGCSCKSWVEAPRRGGD